MLHMAANIGHGLVDLHRFDQKKKNRQQCVCVCVCVCCACEEEIQTVNDLSWLQKTNVMIDSSMYQQ